MYFSHKNLILGENLSDHGFLLKILIVEDNLCDHGMF